MTNNDAALAVIDAFDASGVAYVLVGSYSSNLYGIPRSTQDVDFVVELDAVALAELARSLLPSIRLDRQMSFETVTMTRRFVATVVDTPFKIEFFLLDDDPHHQERFRRRRRVKTLGRWIWMPTAEDVIVTKLRWALLGSRSKDIEDARGVIAVQGDRIDWDYVEPWCDRHGTRDLLEEIRASLPPG